MAKPDATIAAQPDTPDRAEFRRRTGVSRETLARLEIFDARLRQWQRRINLVGRGTLTDVWRRHFLDSAQLLSLLDPVPRRGTWLDIGSGAGFPGLVLAIMGAGHVHLVESDKRKAAFLRDVARECAAPVTVHAERVEAIDPFPVDVITARAVAPVAALLEMAAPFWGPDTLALWPKGRDIDAELTEAAKYWIMTLDRVPSQTTEDGAILRIGRLSRRQRAASPTEPPSSEEKAEP